VTDLYPDVGGSVGASGDSALIEVDFAAAIVGTDFGTRAIALACDQQPVRQILRAAEDDGVGLGVGVVGLRRLFGGLSACSESQGGEGEKDAFHLTSIFVRARGLRKSHGRDAAVHFEL
jgi:hypothetical protein